jgi:hypothetical protein
MAIYSRDQNTVSFQYESGTYAAPTGTNANWIGLVTNHDLTESENYIETRHTGAGNRNYDQQIPGPVDYEGTLTYHPQDFRMFAFALGSVVNVSGTTSVHVISELNGDGRYAYTSGTTQLTNFPSFTVRDSKKSYAGDGNHYVRIVNGCVADTFSLSASNGEVVECEVSYKGQSFTLGSKTTDIFALNDADTSRPYVWSDLKFHLPSGTVVNEINDITYSLENNVENRHFVNGSRVAQAMIPTNRNHTLELGMSTNNTWFRTLSDFHKNGSTFNAMLECRQSATEVGWFIFSGCYITDLGTTSEAEGIDDTTITIRPANAVFIGSDAVRLYGNPY